MHQTPSTSSPSDASTAPGSSVDAVSRLSRATGRWLLAGVAVLGLGVAPAHCEQRGKVYFVADTKAPRGEWQRRPLPDAFVTLTWSITIPAPAHAVTSCRYSELARTDATGEYVMRGPDAVTALLAHVAYEIYSPGLAPIAFPYGGSPMSPQDVTMAFSTRTRDSRLSQLALATEPGCPGSAPADPHALRVPYLQALLEEAKALAVDSPRGGQDVEHIAVTLRRAAGLEPPQGLRARGVPGRIEAAVPAPANPSDTAAPAAGEPPPAAPR